MGNIGAMEIFWIVLLVLIIFGGKKLPQLGSSLGRALFNFRKEVKAADQKDDEQSQPDNNSTEEK